MENPLHKSAVNENRTQEARENMDQEVNRECNENTPNIYELNSVHTKEIELPLHNQGNTHLIHDFCAEKKTVHHIVAHLTVFFYSMFTTSINCADSLLCT